MSNGPIIFNRTVGLAGRTLGKKTELLPIILTMQCRNNMIYHLCILCAIVTYNYWTHARGRQSTYTRCAISIGIEVDSRHA